MFFDSLIAILLQCECFRIAWHSFFGGFFFDGKLTLAVATAAAILFSNSDSILTVLSDSVCMAAWIFDCGICLALTVTRCRRIGFMVSFCFLLVKKYLHF